MKRILAPTDFSNHSLAAAELAANIARSQRGVVSLYHAVEPFEYTTVPGEYRDQRLRELKWSVDQQLESLKRRLSDQIGPDVAIETLSRAARPAQGILGYAVEWNADMICMGTTGTADAESHMFGSVALRVARDSQKPVLTLRNEHRERLPKNGRFSAPVVAIDYSRFALPAVQMAANLSDSGRTVELVHVYYAPDQKDEVELTRILGEARAQELEKLNAFAERVDDIPLAVHVRADCGHIANQLLDHVATSSADLLVIGAHGRDQKIALLGTVADRIIRTAACPVLVIPDRFTS